MKFEWDSQKADSNLKKHAVSFQEAASVLGDALSITYPDPDHSARENRFITVGMSRSGRVLMVAHTNRGDNIRIISARKTTRKERRYYEEGE
ncbi:MAG TPA: BrnT family toxin [Sedimentisphaerales bacterium]|nr:BrnT family toxin [Sedimentisphaerales bacterium]